LTALRDFCHKNWKGAAKSYNAFLAVDREVAERLKQNRLEQQAQQAIEPYRQKILDILLAPETFCTMTTLHQFANFVYPIRVILSESTQGFPQTLQIAFECLINSLPAKKAGPLWVKKEEELAKDPRQLNVFTKAFRWLLGSLYLYCHKKTASAQDLYDVFASLLTENTFWQLAQKSIDPFREYIQAILIRADYSSLQDSNDFITFTTPLVKVLEKATKHSRDYLSEDSFYRHRFEHARQRLDPPMFLEALHAIRKYASDARGGWVAMSSGSQVLDKKQTHQALLLDAAQMQQTVVHQAGPFFLAALRNFCDDDWASAANNYDNLLKVDFKRKYIDHYTVRPKEDIPKTTKALYHMIWVGDKRDKPKDASGNSNLLGRLIRLCDEDWEDAPKNL